MTFSILFSKSCYRDKYKQVCFKRYYDTKSLKKPRYDEKYYLSNTGNIYTFKDKLIVKFKYSGAILSILNDFDVEFIDKKRDKYILQVNEPNELLGIITNLNKLNSVTFAKPKLSIKRKKGYVKPEQRAFQKKKKKVKNKFAPQVSDSSNDQHFGKKKTGLLKK
jgi:hypothetical protein